MQEHGAHTWVRPYSESVEWPYAMMIYFFAAAK
jgi:hypothetical protein